jgi:hypothetical protein
VRAIAAGDTGGGHPGDQFHDPPIDGDTGVRRTLEMVVAVILDERN